VAEFLEEDILYVTNRK